ncbi:MAG: hypothetical protein IMF20_02315, partial [Proteobacteria bacterium]|nr:hypothetical protein [Pseudomonadota bacterium]
EHWEGEREEVKEALQTVRGAEPPRVKKEKKPLTADEGFGVFLLDLMGKGVEKVGEGVEAVTETSAAKAYKKFRAKSRIAEAMVGGELKPEVMKLVKKGDSESLASAAKLLEKDEGFYQSWIGEKAEEHIAKPIAEAAAAGGKSLGKMIEKIRPTTHRGSYKYYVTSAIEGVGATMGPALAVSIMTKNPGLGMAVMFPQVFGEVYSETRTDGKGVLESSQKAMFYAAAEVLSEGLPLGILTKPGGKLTKKVFKSAGAEGIQEAVNEATQIAYDEGIIDEYTPHHEIGRRLLDAGIIGAIGGGGMAMGTHAFTGKEEDATVKLKKDVLNGITETYDKGELDVGRAIDSVMEGYRGGLFDDSDLDRLSKKYPELKDGIKVAKVDVRVRVVKDTLVNSIAEGLETGVFEGKVFTEDHAISFIRSGFENDIFIKEDIEEFKERHPELKYGLNDLLAEQVVSEIAEPITEPTIKEPEVYAIQDIENIYLGAKARVRTEPYTLHEIQERFKERQGREATAKEQEELNRIYEKAKRRSQKRKIFEERRKEKEAPLKTKEELELEAYEPVLPPIAKEVRVKEGKRTYPRGAEYIAGKPAPEDLEVEYKPVLKKAGKKETPWLTLNGARDALESDKMKTKDISPATHKVVGAPGGYCIVPIKAKGLALAREVKEEVKGKTLLSWVRAMGGVKDLTLPGEVRALSTKETGVIGLTGKGLAFDEMAAEATEEGWIAKPEDFAETLRGDIFAQKEGKPRAERLADIATRTEREERWKEFDRAEDDMLKYFAEHPDEEIVSDFDRWQKEGITDIRSRNEARRTEEIEEDTRREVEAENKDLEGLKEDEGFSEFIEAWDEREALDEETLAELEAWRVEEKEKPVEPVEPIWEEGRRPSDKVILGARKIVQAEKTERKKIIKETGLPSGISYGLIEKQAETKTTKEIEAEQKEKLVKPEVKDPIPSILSSKKKTGVNYEMEVMVAETGETVTVTKDAGVALRETKEELDKYNKFLECLI